MRNNIAFFEKFLDFSKNAILFLIYLLDDKGKYYTYQ